MGTVCSSHGEKRNVYRILVGKSERKRQLGRQRIGPDTDLGEVGWCGINWIHLAQDVDQWRVFVHANMKLRAP
jgi:hypothetical protein